MANYLWSITAKRNNGKLVKGMSIEIMKTGTNAKPSQKEIAQALNNKYSTNIGDGMCGITNFDFVQKNK